MLSPYIAAAFAAVAVENAEEDRFVQSFLLEFPAKSVLCVSAAGGPKGLRTCAVVDTEAGFSKAFEIAARHLDTLLVVFDWHHLARSARIAHNSNPLGGTPSTGEAPDFDQSACFENCKIGRKTKLCALERSSGCSQ